MDLNEIKTCRSKAEAVILCDVLISYQVTHVTVPRAWVMVFVKHAWMKGGCSTSVSVPCLDAPVSKWVRTVRTVSLHL